MFFRVLAALVAADALDRHEREREHAAWAAAEADRLMAACVERLTIGPARKAPGWDPRAPERP
jgi:hypothetical protein